MRYSVATAAAVAPVTLLDGKSQCRVDTNEDDQLITDYINTATSRCELAARRTFITTTYDLWFDRWPVSSIDFPLPPLQSVTGFYYTDEDGTETEWSSDNYIVDTTSTPGRLQFKRTAVLPSVVLQEINAVRIRFVAGYGDAPSDVPEIYKQAIKMLLGHYYENREALLVAQGLSLSELPLGVADLLGINRGSWF
jgi:uncharacterized phiE125 gp8 family phage protein